MKKYNRIITIVLDSLGVGAALDAEKYGDVGSDTLGHIAEANNGLNIPYLRQLGLANLHSLKNVEPISEPKAYYTKLSELSLGKDTMTGHWELMGLFIDKPFQTFTDTGFPDDLIQALKEKTGHDIIGNKSASGTEILDELGEEHMRTGAMIVYTSADSVLQIAAHEETFGLEELYRCCEIARDLTMADKWKVGRIIARPFVGAKKGEFKRTSNRHDYALKPFGRTVLDELKDANYDVISVGKINDIFDGEGVTKAIKSKSNYDGMEKTIELVQTDFNGLLFTNLVDFDALWGHRRDPIGYGKEIENFDDQLRVLLKSLKEDDLLILTADHGNDPSTPSTDHDREYIPILVYGKQIKENVNLGIRETFSDISATVLDILNMPKLENGTSFKNEILK